MRPGTLIADRYEILRLAGGGGMGDVYQARDKQSGEVIALKLIRTEDDELARRLMREGRALAELSHPNIVRYLSHGVTASGEPFVAMEWLIGEDLGRRLKRGPLSIVETCQLGRAVCEALAAAHRRGFVHRDIKPTNIFLAVQLRLDEATQVDPVPPSVRDAQVKVLDFGLALLGQGLAPRTATAYGTPGYMAPEQARGGGELDGRTDLFSLGCVLYTCLAGRPPFFGDSPDAVLAKVLFDEPTRLRAANASVSVELDELVSTLLSKDPAQRPPDARLVANRLAEIELSAARVPSPAPTTLSAAVGREEQVHLCVLAAGPVQLGADGEAPAALIELAGAFGARLEPRATAAIIAVFTAAVHATDVAARAARCALALRPLVPGATLVVATGRGVNPSDAPPTGEVIDRALELLGGAEPGVVRLDRVTAGLLDLRFEIGRGPSGTWLVEERGVVAGARPLLGRHTSCVGRDRELAALQALCAEAIEEPGARAALLLGAPGSGKTRLRLEFLDRLKDSGYGGQIWIGRGDPMRTGSPHTILADALREPFGLRGGESLAQRHELIRARVGRHFRGDDHARISEFLGELCASPFPDADSPQLAAARQDPMLMGDQLRRAFEEFLTAELEAGPLVLVLEDLQWGDWPSIKLMDAALRVLDTRPLFLLALGRPEVLEMFAGLWAERRLEQMRLRELPRASCERLIRQVLGAGPRPELVARVALLSQGNPFFLEELIRSLAEGGGEELPATVLAMVDSRLGRLPLELRQVLRAASLFGEVCWDNGVAALLGNDAVTARPFLAELTEREWLSERRDSRFAGTRAYGFGHSLLREVAYASLTDEDRRLGHRLAAAWLVGVGESDPVVLAEHYERGGEATVAVGFWSRAAQQALDSNDFETVIARCERAVRLGATGESLGVLRLLQAEAHGWRREYALAAPRASEALAILPRGGDLWANAVHQSAWALRVLGRSAELVALADDLAAVFAETQSGALIISTCATAIKLIEAGNYPHGSALIDAVERSPLAQAGGHALVDAWIANARVYRASISGNPDAMLRALRGSVENWERAGDQRNACIARANIGVACNELGAFAEAEAALTAVIVTAERLGLGYVVDGGRQNLGWARALRGALDAARENELTAAANFRERGDWRSEGMCHVYLARIALSANQPARAAEEAGAALTLMAEVPAWRAYGLAVQAQARRLTDDPAGALTAARQANELLASLGALEEGEAYVRLALVEALEATGAVAEARAALAMAQARLTERAARISDPELRRSFLENVPEHARTMRTAQG